VKDLKGMELKGLPVYVEHNYNDIVGTINYSDWSDTDGYVVGFTLKDEYKDKIDKDILNSELCDLSLTHAMEDDNTVGIEVSLTKKGNRYGTHLIKNNDKINYYRKLVQTGNDDMIEKMTEVVKQDTPKTEVDDKSDDSLLKVMKGLKSDNVKLIEMSQKLNNELANQKSSNEEATNEILKLKTVIKEYENLKKKEQIETLNKNGSGLLEKLKESGVDIEALDQSFLQTLNQTVLHMNSVHTSGKNYGKRSNMTFNAGMEHYNKQIGSILGTKRYSTDLSGFSDSYAAKRARILK